VDQESGQFLGEAELGVDEVVVLVDLVDGQLHCQLLFGGLLHYIDIIKENK
jgi:hypothetical protein